MRSLYETVLACCLSVSGRNLYSKSLLQNWSEPRKTGGWKSSILHSIVRCFFRGVWMKKHPQAPVVLDDWRWGEVMGLLKICLACFPIYLGWVTNSDLKFISNSCWWKNPAPVDRYFSIFFPLFTRFLYHRRWVFSPDFPLNHQPVSRKKYTNISRVGDFCFTTLPKFNIAPEKSPSQ